MEEKNANNRRKRSQKILKKLQKKKFKNEGKKAKNLTERG